MKNATQSYKESRKGNTLPKGVSCSFLIPCGRDCVAAKRESAKEGKHFFCAPSGAQFLLIDKIACGYKYDTAHYNIICVPLKIFNLTFIVLISNI